MTDHPSHGTWNPGGAGLVLHTIVSDPANAKKSVDRNLGRRRIRDRGRRRDVGAPQTACRMPKPVRITIIPLRRATVRSDTAFTTSCARRAPPTCSISRITSASGARPMAAGAGTTGPRVCRRPLAFRSESTRAIRTPSGRSRSTATWPALSARRGCGGVAVTRRRAKLAGDASGPSAAGLFLHRAASGDWRATRAIPRDFNFGTNSGSVFASFDEGESWQEIARHLPTILAVEVLEGK